MLNVRQLEAQDLRGLSPGALTEFAEKMLHHIGQQSKQTASQAQATKLRDAELERISLSWRA